MIAECLAHFYKRRLTIIRELNLKKIIRRKNPYLFKALATEKAADIVEQVLLAYLSASDETIFGNCFFEPIAIAVSEGTVAPAAGVDFAKESKTTYTAYAMKSGPYIFNSSQKLRQSDEFNELRKRLYKLHKQFDPVLAAGYGRTNQLPTKKRPYRVSSGQSFWKEITGDSDFYLKIIALMKDYPAAHKALYRPEWDAAVNRLTIEFANEFCLSDGHIDWEKLTKFVSQERTLKIK